MFGYQLNSIYISVRNMDRAIGFYEELFGQEAEVVDERFSVFLLGEMSFGLYSPAADGVTVAYGANCVPNFEVDDVEAEYSRLKGFVPAIDDEVTVLPEMELFQFKDTEDNILEVYSYT